MEEKELLTIVGGASKISATMLNSISRVAQILLEIGKTLGFSKERIRQIENIAIRKLKEKDEIIHLKEYCNKNKSNRFQTSYYHS